MDARVLKRRWAELEERSSAIYSMMFELEQKFSDYPDENIKETAVYLLLQQEDKLISKEQQVIERSGALSE